MALGGEVTAADIIAEKPELEEIRTAVEKHGLTDFANIVQKDLDMHIKTINEAKIRIDEASKALTGLDDIKVLEEQARGRILLAQKPVDELLEERAAIVSGIAVKNITDQNSALEAKMEEIKAKHRELIAEVKKPYLEKMAILDSDVVNAAERVRPLRQQYRISEDRIKNIDTTLEGLRKQWAEIDEEIFDETECPCCHRPYDAGMTGKMLEEFNMRKSQSLGDIDAEGQKLSEEKRKLIEINKYSGLEVEAPELKREILDAMAAAVSKARPLEAMEGFLNVRDRVDLNKRKLEELQLDVKVQLRIIDDKLEPYQKALSAANETLAKIKTESEVRERIARLTAERDTARHLVDDLQRKKSLVKLWSTTAAELGTAHTNGMFKFVSFRLFTKTLSTDDIKETCELMMNGVPYRNLSTAEKIIAGIDVINAISSARKVSNPIFVDNRESIVQLPECPEQVINLIVSGEDKNIRVQKEGIENG